jgi:hypothetical protein
MRNRNLRQSNGLDWFFDRVFPKLFIGIFALVATVILVQFAVIGYAGYKLLTDPHGTANFIGTVAGEAIKPVADAIKE